MAPVIWLLADQCRVVDLIDRGHPGQRHRHAHLLGEDIQQVFHPRLAGGRQRIHGRAPQQTTLGSEGYEGSDRSRSRSRSASPLPREDHILNRFDYDGAVDPDDGMDGLPRSYSTIPIVPRAQAESPEDRPLYATQPEPPGRTKKKKKKSKRSAMPENELELEGSEGRNTYREQAPSAEPIARAHAERDGDVGQDAPSKKKRDKHRSKTPRHQPDLPEEEEATQPFPADFNALSLSSQQDHERRPRYV